MRLSRVTLKEPTWDPAKVYTHEADRSVHRAEFLAADGYTLELAGGLMAISHSERTNVVSAVGVRSSEVAPPEKPAAAPPPPETGKPKPRGGK